MRTPVRPEQVTPDFLTAILRSLGLLHRAVVTATTVESLAAKTSFNAQLARVYLTYDRRERDAPRSLIAKLPTLKADLHQRAAVFQPGAKESWFYRHGAARTPLNVPRCYFNAVDDATGESALLLEDLAPAYTGDWVEGVSEDEAELALRSLARLHAAWWATDPAAEPELARLMDSPKEEQDLVERLYGEAWPRFLESTVFDIPETVREFGEHLLGRISATEAMLEHSPRTLLHGDFRLGNILFDVRAGEPACWVIDWEDITLWNGMFDVAWFLGGCLRVADRDEEERLVRSYHAALTREGVEGYPWTQCYDDYRRAMLSAFVQGVLTAVPEETGDGYAQRLAHVVGERFISACQRWRLYELLPKEREKSQCQ
jgi:hypothetical protein